MRCRAALAGAALTVALLGLGTARAAALPLPIPIPSPFGSCPNPAPTPSTPGTGASGSLNPEPPPGWQTAAPTDIWATYQVPFSFTVYNPGCLPGNVIQQPQVEAHIWTFFGNLFLGTAEVLVSAGAAVHNLVADPAWLNALDQLQTEVTAALSTDVWAQFAGISLLVLAAVLVWEGRKANLGGVWRKAIWALAVIVLVAASTGAGVLITHQVANGELSVMSATDAAIGANSGATSGSAADLEVQSLLYPAWLRGEIGSSTSQTALVYGPQLLDGSAYSWAETPGGTPLTGVTGQKAATWNAAASAIRHGDPSAYGQMTGKGAARAGAGIEAFIWAVVTVPFGLIADALTAASLLVFVLGLMILPVVGILGLHQRLDSLVKNVVIACAAGLLNALLFHVAATIQVKASGFLFAHFAWWQALFFVALTIPLLWVLSRPMRRLLRMPSRHHNYVHEMEQSFGKGRRTATAAGVAVGAAVVGAPEAAAVYVSQAVRGLRRRNGPDQEPGAVEPTEGGADGGDPAVVAVDIGSHPPPTQDDSGDQPGQPAALDGGAGDSADNGAEPYDWAAHDAVYAGNGHADDSPAGDGEPGGGGAGSPGVSDVPDSMGQPQAAGPVGASG